VPLKAAPELAHLRLHGRRLAGECAWFAVAAGLGVSKSERHASRVRAAALHLGAFWWWSQLAISMTLLVGASLFIRSLVKLNSVDTGMRIGGVFLVDVTSKHHFHATASGRFQSAILARLGRMPGVVASSAANMVPLGGGVWKREVQVEGHAFLR